MNGQICASRKRSHIERHIKEVWSPSLFTAACASWEIELGDSEQLGESENFVYSVEIYIAATF